MTSKSHSHRVKVTIDVSEEERMYIKMLAAKKRVTISEFIMSFVRPNIPHDEPNAKTQKAMRDVDEGENLTHCKTTEEFWLAVGIDPNAWDRIHQSNKKGFKKISAPKRNQWPENFFDFSPIQDTPDFKGMRSKLTDNASEDSLA